MTAKQWEKNEAKPWVRNKAKQWAINGGMRIQEPFLWNVCFKI